MRERPTKRPHRRVHHPGTNCKCPPESKPISTCKPNDGNKCRGRKLSCVARVMVPGYTKPLPRFVPLDCGPEAGPVEQWKPVPGYRKKKKTGLTGKQLTLELNKRTSTEQMNRFSIPNGRSVKVPPFVD